MFFPKCPLWCLFFSLCSSASSLEFINYDGDAVIWPQVLTDCTIENSLYSPDVQFKASFKLCCKARWDCALCLVLETEVIIPEDKYVEVESYSGTDEEDYHEDARNEKYSIKACYQHVASTLTICKKVECSVNYTTLAYQKKNKISIVITDGFHFGSPIYVYPNKSKIVAPSEKQVCSQEILQKRIPMCPVPTFRISSVYRENHIELKIVGNNKTNPSLCVKYEKNGRCLGLNQKTIPLHSVAPCMCIEAWDKNDDRSLRLQSCPFDKKGLPPHLQKSLWNNISVNVRLRKLNDWSTVLFWNLAAPCRLDGEVLLRSKTTICKNFARVSNWTENSNGLWEKKGAFENIDERISHCVMVKINGTQKEFCSPDSGRLHWTLLFVGIMMLVCLSTLMVYFLHDYVKKWVWSWRHGGFVKIGKKCHVVLVSPPDVDDPVSESVCQLGSQLHSQGFSVALDVWSRKDQCTMGPLLWLYSHLEKRDHMGVRVLLVLNQKALEKTEEWTLLNNYGEGMDLQEKTSLYSDLFTASLSIIQAKKRQGTAASCFVLVKIDSDQNHSHNSDRRLPELLQGLPLFLLPSQSQSFTAELTVVQAETGFRV